MRACPGQCQRRDRSLQDVCWLGRPLQLVSSHVYRRPNRDFDASAETRAPYCCAHTGDNSFPRHFAQKHLVRGRENRAPKQAFGVRRYIIAASPRGLLQPAPILPLWIGFGHRGATAMSPNTRKRSGRAFPKPLARGRAAAVASFAT